MKQTLILATLVLLTAGFAWAEEPAAAPAEAVAPAAASDVAAEPLFAQGSCELPDLAGLSEEEVAAAAFAAGLETSPSAVAAAPPACPVTFHCNSIGNCGIGPLCAVTDIGPCCTRGSWTLCCVVGTIKVKRCPCKCNSALCAVNCAASNEVTWGCS